MLELRPNCECCDVDLAPQLSGAFICSFECTFCSTCAERMAMKCPNCGGELVKRPTRAIEKLAKYPGSSKRVVRATPCPGIE
jgi:hypothetical protein